MPENLYPPIVPPGVDDFATHCASHPLDWFEYFGAAHARIQKQEEELSSLRSQTQDLRAQATLLQSQLEKAHADTVEAKIEAAIAKRLTTPTALTPSPAHAAGTPQSSAPAPCPTSDPRPTSTRLSERLPDPDKFDGTTTDLRRFVTQIRRKLTVNRDRYTTPVARLAYISDRLKGAAYAQVLPYLEDSTRLTDFEAVLTLLEKAFGDPDRVNRARRELYRLRQNNKDFNAHLAEFQRLALEGELDESGLFPLLENSLSRELQQMLLHQVPPSSDFATYTSFLQDLDNRQRRYNAQNLGRGSRTSGPPAIQSSARNQQTPTQGNPAPTKTVTPVQDPNAMDLSNLRRNTRRDNGECYRCGSKDHLVARCPQPDTRQLRTAHLPRPASPARSSRTRHRGSRSSSRSSHSDGSSKKGVRLD